MGLFSRNAKETVAQVQQAQLPPPQPYKPEANPYEVIRIPQLPDLSQAPAEMQAFRDQCAAGVRQAVAMITAMEHQLWWERSRRQQAEDDCKVLLAAIHAERNMSAGAVDDMRAAVAEAKAQLSQDKLKLAADELPKASAAATTIQKNFRGHAARKEYEAHLRDILRGVDPDLDPTTLPATAQHHISSVNAQHIPQRLGLRAALEGVDASGAPLPGSQMLAKQHQDALGTKDPRLQHLRKEVDVIEKRMQMLPDAGGNLPNVVDPQLDIKQILKGTYPASSAQVIAALVKRCKELQAALVEAAERVRELELAQSGLKDANAKVLELSQVHIELEEERQQKGRLQQVVNKLRHIVAAQAQTEEGAAGAARHNPHISAWYRRQYAGAEFAQYPPARGKAGSSYVFDGPDAEVEFWDDLRPGMPDPVLVPKEETQQYKDLLAMQLEMQQARGGAAPAPVDPLYAASVPDTSNFVYPRDTPLMPMATPAPLIRETLGTYTGPWDYQTGAHQDQTAQRAQGPAYQQQQQQQQQPAAVYSPPPPVVPMYSVLPLIKENEYMRTLPDSAFQPPLPPYSTQHGYAPANAARHMSAPGALPQQQPSPYSTYSSPPPQHPSASFTTAAAPSTPPNFDYQRDTPTMYVYGSPPPAPTSSSIGGAYDTYTVQQSRPSDKSLRGHFQAAVGGSSPAAPPTPPRVTAPEFAFTQTASDIEVRTPLPLLREGGQQAAPAGMLQSSSLPQQQQTVYAPQLSASQLQSRVPSMSSPVMVQASPPSAPYMAPSTPAPQQSQQWPAQQQQQQQQLMQQQQPLVRSSPPSASMAPMQHPQLVQSSAPSATGMGPVQQLGPQPQSSAPSATFQHVPQMQPTVVQQPYADPAPALAQQPLQQMQPQAMAAPAPLPSALPAPVPQAPPLPPPPYAPQLPPEAYPPPPRLPAYFYPR